MARKSNLPGLLLIMGILMVVGGILNHNNRDEEPRARTPESFLIEAFVMSQQYVERKLRCPSTAKFPLAGASHTVITGAGNYLTSSYVDSQNGFGAMGRTRYYCELKHNEESDSWKLISLVFPDQEKKVKKFPARKTERGQRSAGVRPEDLQIKSSYYIGNQVIKLYRESGNSASVKAILGNQGIIQVLGKAKLGDSYPYDLWYDVVAYNSSLQNVGSGWLRSKDLSGRRLTLFKQ